MPTLARAVPHLRRLNMSWLAMVNDWGLGQLTNMVDMQDLNLRATGKPAVLSFTLLGMVFVSLLSSMSQQPVVRPPGERGLGDGGRLELCSAPCTGAHRRYHQATMLAESCHMATDIL